MYMLGCHQCKVRTDLGMTPDINMVREFLERHLDHNIIMAHKVYDVIERVYEEETDDDD